jgi:copper transport protein
MATWVGGLVILVTAVLPRRDPVEYAETLPVFSRTAFTCVVVIAVTGTYAAWRGVGSWRALVDTEYGLLVLGKVALLLALMALGNLSRVMIQRRVRRPVVAFAITDAALDEAVDEPEPPPMDDLHIERMRRSVLVEIVLALGVLGLTALLVTQPRGAEALAGQVPSQVTATAPLAQHASALVTVRPGEHGRIAITVRLQGETAKSVQATATQQAAQVGPLPIKLRRTGSTTWTATNVNLPVSGSWTITLVVGASEFEAVTTDATVDLK